MTRHPNFKGGSLASSGYRIRYVGKSHHLADVRGYAYEHRVVAEEILGRRLRPKEVVHHKDGDKTNNAKGNLEIFEKNGSHLRKHFTKRTDRRKEGESNPFIACACGCGSVFAKFDDAGRPRKYVNAGHRWRGKSRKGQRGKMNKIL